MALAEQESTASANGARDSIPVQNPATGELVRTIPAVQPGDVADIVARARKAQPAWEALGFDGRAKILRRAQKWVVDNADRIVDTIVSETGKTSDSAFISEITYTAGALGFWAKRAPGYLADERLRSWSPLLAGRKLVV